MNEKQRAVLIRITSIEQAIARAKEYLATGRLETWKELRPWFVRKWQDGKPMPPHPDWVKNVFLPRMERELTRSERAVERLELTSKR